MDPTHKISRALNQRGYSLVETMVAAGLLGFIALAMFPAIITMLDGLKVQTFRSMCTSIVRAKLQEYVNGVGSNAGVALGYTPSGFEYTKLRYQQHADEVQSGSLKGCQVNPDLGIPGFRERINSNLIVSPTASNETDSAGNQVPARLQGFQLYVNLRHYNPRVVTNGQATRQCPTTAAPSTYQFLRLGDGIEVVVTGMLRIQPTVATGGRGGVKWGKFDDKDASTPNQALVCSASQVVYPPHLPFRYYLGSDGKLRNTQTQTSLLAAGESADAAETHFRSIWLSGSTVISNIRSVSVSPENNSVYILKPGSVIRYGGSTSGFCSDGAVTVNGVTYNGVPDCPVAPDRAWTVDPNVENITVDFGPLLSDTSDDLIYGLFNTGSTASASAIRLLNQSTSTWGSSTLTLTSDRPRINGIFIAPTFPALSAPDLPNLFYFDNTCYNTGSTVTMGTTSYCVSVFNSADSNMVRDVRELPTQVQDISY